MRPSIRNRAVRLASYTASISSASIASMTAGSVTFAMTPSPEPRPDVDGRQALGRSVHGFPRVMSSARRRYRSACAGLRDTLRP